MKILQINTTKKYPDLKYTLNFLDSLNFPEIESLDLSMAYLSTYNIVDRINDHLFKIISYYNFMNDDTKNDPLFMHEKSTSITMYYIETEEIVYWIRKYIDVIISLSYILNYLKENKKEPQKIIIDSIGKYLNPNLNVYKCFEKFLWLFQSVNDVSNYYKHSIYNTNLNILGKFEPCISAFGTENKHNSIKVYNISLSELISEFERFVIESKNILNEIL